MSAVVEHAVQASLITRAGEAEPLPVGLRYRTEDPLAVHLVFPASACLTGTETEWTFARELLHRGLGGLAGRGDVRLWPAGPRHTVLALRGVQGRALVRMETAGLRCFLDACHARVPLGAERLVTEALDREFAEFLRDV